MVDMVGDDTAAAAAAAAADDTNIKGDLPNKRKTRGVYWFEGNLYVPGIYGWMRDDKNEAGEWYLD